jgi:GT2 family glycosyltransferase
MAEAQLAVIIPTRNRQDMLKRCLLQIAPPGSVLSNTEIIVSDDGDVDQTRLILASEFPHIRFVQGPRRGPAANRNNGAANVLTAPELFIFLDDDCIPESNLLEVYRRLAAERPDVDVFEGRISALGKSTGFADSAPDNETGGHLWSCNFAVRSATFDRIHGFDERFCFAANEDMDLHLRLKAVGKVQFVPEARVFHHYETRSGPKPLRHKALSSILYFHLHSPQKTGHRAMGFVRAAVKYFLLHLPRHIRRGETSHPFHFFRLVAYNLRLALVLAFWPHHGRLARWLYKPCCSGCRQILDIVNDPANVSGNLPMRQRSVPENAAKSISL